ncbi:beta-glucosidase [Propionicimonas paludicola]|uniref:Exo-alpha-(1->6)-L-arabinopyranosidase n=1 Tax=Propionicimonas paludicola TaxID=185243 RepID=A0A2A9CU34_9ACTN|nr:glycoside hydrolase family 3 C-terminal domain-containing protein [Propionicimonas paludicola]PFG17152.1 beta-glucosidase [Propionicimonas paludicola]
MTTADVVVSQLSLEQLAAMVSGADDWRTVAIPELGLAAAEVSDGPHGLRTETGVDQVWIPSTAFPTASALGATWDRDLIRRVGVALGEESRAMGIQLLLGPGINLKRTPLCGRNFEYFSEDPVLTAELASAYIDGLQSQGIGACLKHFAANNQETERTEISVEADERTLRELYLEAFRRVIATADPWAVMCSYNRIWGTHASQHHWLLTQVLRDEWGYDGLLVSDWDAVHDPVAAVAAGMELEMPGTGGRSAAAIVAAVNEGRLERAVLERAARRVVAFALRALPDGRPAPSPVRDPGIVPGQPLSAEQRAGLGEEAHHQLAREAATAAMTLLRNQNRVLPLAADSTAKLAVIGGYATVPRIQGGGSAGLEPLRVDQPLAAITAIAGDRVSYAPGYPLARTDFYREFEIEGPADADALRAEAVAVAEAVDVVVAFVGLPIAAEVEAADRHSLELPADQVELLKSLVAVGKPLVVVLAAGSAVTMDEWHDGAHAILLSWLGGQGVGTAVAEVLFGRAEPSGRLGESYPMRLADTPGHDTFPGADGVVHYAEGPFIGYRWYDAQHLDVRYPFGHGLSYTDFAYGEAELVAADGDAVEVAVSVTNTGQRRGSEIVQLYLEPPAGGPARPPRELRGFEKLTLEPGQTATARFRLGVRDFAFADTEAQCWRQLPGRYQVVIGSSSRTLHARLDVQRQAASLPFGPSAVS